MDRLSKLVAAAALVAGATGAHAFVFPEPPPGFGGSGGNWTFAPPAGSRQVDMIIRQSKGLTVGVPGAGRVGMDVGYKLGPAAKRAAAAAIFAHPYVRTAAGIATWLGVGKLVWDEVDRVWKVDDPSGIEGYEVSTGYKFSGNPNATLSELYFTPTQACQALMPGFSTGGYIATFTSVSYSNSIDKCHYRIHNPTTGDTQDSYVLLYRFGGSSCPAGWYVTPAGCVQTPPPQTVTTPEEFADKLDPHPMPETVPGELPRPTPLPIVKPSPWVNPDPATPNPTHRPMFVPTGDPVPNPQYDPTKPISPQNQPYVQPGVRLSPSPTLTDPFRIDAKPIDRPKPDGTPSPEPTPEAPPNIPGQPQPGDQSKPENPPGLCDEYPDILACVKLDKPDEPDIPEKQKEISITPDSGWGSEGGTCPPPRTLMVQGRDIPIPFDLFCTYMNGLRPIIIAMAWLSAAFILVGAREGN